VRSVPVPIITIVVAFTALCVVSDLRTRRIPNVISGPAMLCGIILNTGYLGAAGLLASLAGLAVGIGVLILPFAGGGIGGGDVKMMGAVGAFLGPRLTLLGLTAGMILGGGIMVVHLARQGRLREKLRATAAMFKLAAVSRSAASLRVSAAEPTAVTLPYSVPLALGTLAAIGLSGFLGL
jgi:prepilin peptidase CpaA